MSPQLTASAPLTALRGIGPKRAEALSASGFHTVGDLLLHLPHRYEDRRHRSQVDGIAREGGHLFVGKLSRLSRVRIRRRGMTLVRGVLDDGTGRLGVCWFNRPYLLHQVVEDEEYLLFGSVRQKKGAWELVNPSVESVGRGLHGDNIVPVYPALGSLGPATLRGIFARLLDSMDLESLVDPIPDVLLQRHGLPKLSHALLEIHRPGKDQDVEALNGKSSNAHGRICYGEFLDLQVELQLVRGLETRVPKRHSYELGDDLWRRFRTLVSFELTGAQDRVLRELLQDMSRPEPMLRLLQGDVGCGKTIVAALALVAAMESGLQGALMAPTEILAEQHYRSLSEVLGKRYRIGKVTGSSVDAAEVRSQLESGDLQLVIGTHALIQESTVFDRLGLAVIDEQHRFGVSQRQLLQAKGDRPDVLVMTATPIPRSLALTVYGDLALSVIDELPPGRLPVSTRVVSVEQRPKVYTWLRGRLEAGDQAYVVVPLIEQSERISAESIASMSEQVREWLRGHSLGVLHGRTPAEERDELIRRFARGELDVLMATTVIEVGLDVAAATVMIIESCERFGLSQLHQLRGRVGRGARQSACVAVHGRLGAEARHRLEIFEGTSDGFEIAEADLEIRGPGDLLGTRQSGLPLFRVADIVRDVKWLEAARQDALELVTRATEWDAVPLLDELESRAASRLQCFAGG